MPSAIANRGQAARGGTRRTLFGKYFLALFAAVFVPLLLSGGIEAGFGYIDQRAMIANQQRIEARHGAERAEAFLREILDQIGWTVHLPVRLASVDQHRLDALRLLRQVPAILRLRMVDGKGSEVLSVSRVDVDVVGSRKDLLADPAVAGAMAAGQYFGPVYFNRGSEPYMTIALAGKRQGGGVAVAEVNLKLIWDTIAGIEVGNTGFALLIDATGRLIAHPDISRVLRGGEDRYTDDLRSVLSVLGADARVGFEWQFAGVSRLATAAPVNDVGWTIIVEQPLSEAFAPIRAALLRTLVLLAAGAIFVAMLAWLLARRVAGPIGVLEEGTRRIGMGDLSHRIGISTGDELQRLAENFNAMAEGLALSQERSRRIDRLRRFLESQIAEIVVAFCDLRGFTAFAAHAEPEAILGLLNEYLAVLGPIIGRIGATQTSFLGDGLMLLLNAPVRRERPAEDAVEMASAMQRAVQDLAGNWRARGHRLGFGIGMAMGPATVGQIGYDLRMDYTAIGHVVNLASRLCSTAQDGEILIDARIAGLVAGSYRLQSRGEQQLRGLSAGMEVHAVDWRAAPPLAQEGVVP